jgi:hypothetical protein
MELDPQHICHDHQPGCLAARSAAAPIVNSKPAPSSPHRLRFGLPGKRWFVGINFSAKTPLEVAILLASSSVSAQAVTAIGPALLAGEAGVVPISIVASYGAGRLPGLPGRMATLVACANSICGNSANAAGAPVPLG